MARSMRVLALALLAVIAVTAPGASAEAVSTPLRAGSGAGPRRGLRLFRTKDEEAAHKQQREALVNVRPARRFMARPRARARPGCTPPGARIRVSPP